MERRACWSGRASIRGSPRSCCGTRRWADEATLDLLRFIVRRIEAAPLLLVVTYRDDADVPPGLRGLLGDLATLAAVRHVALSLLTSEGVVAMAMGSGRDAA